MHVIEIESGRSGYVDVVQYVVKHGRRRNARGLPTLDAGPTTIVIHDPRWALPIGCGRNLSVRLAAVEALQLIGGFSDPELTRWAAPRFAEFAESDGHYHGAYGRRIGYQLPAELGKLRRDHDTRQAIITLWDPWLDNLPNRKDYPCTLALRLSLDNDDRLDLNVLMRSNDGWLGTPTDWFQFSQLQLTAARVLDVEPGKYQHTAWSLHIYESDLEKIDSLHRPITGEWTLQDKPVLGVGRPGDSIDTVMRRARFLTQRNGLDSLVVSDSPGLTESEEWYRDRLAPYATRLG